MKRAEYGSIQKEKMRKWTNWQDMLYIYFFKYTYFKSIVTTTTKWASSFLSCAE